MNVLKKLICERYKPRNKFSKQPKAITKEYYKLMVRKIIPLYHKTKHNNT